MDLSAVQSHDSLFFTGRPTKMDDESLFNLSLTDIRGVIYGPRGTGSIIYGGEYWAVGDSKKLSGKELKLDELVPPGNGEPGKARFIVDFASREVIIEDGNSGVKTLTHCDGWMINNGQTAMIPNLGFKAGQKVTSKVQGRLVIGRIEKVDGSWAIVSIAMEPYLTAPRVTVPANETQVVIVTPKGQILHAPYKMLISADSVPPVLKGSVVITSDGMLVGLIGGNEGFVPSLGEGEGRFNPAQRKIECMVEPIE
jgi:hypothetical protein